MATKQFDNASSATMKSINNLFSGSVSISNFHFLFCTQLPLLLCLLTQLIRTFKSYRSMESLFRSFFRFLQPPNCLFVANIFSANDTRLDIPHDSNGTFLPGVCQLLSHLFEYTCSTHERGATTQKTQV